MTIKKLLATCFVATTCVCTAQAQNDDSNKLYYGVFAGYSLNNFVGDDANGDMKHGFHAGGLVGYHFHPIFFAEGALSFATKGNKSSGSASSGQYWDDYGSNYDSNVDTKMTTYNIEIPLYIGAQYNGAFVKVGPYLSYAVAGEKNTTGKTQ